MLSVCQVSGVKCDMFYVSDIKCDICHMTSEHEIGHDEMGTFVYRVVVAEVGDVICMAGVKYQI